MSRQLRTLWVVLTCASLLSSGCSPINPVYFFEDGDLSHYKGVATEIEYPDVDVHSLAEVDGALPPLTIRHADAQEIWDLTLEEAIQNALANSKVMRQIGGQVITAPDFLLRAPDAVPTVYDPAIRETDPRVGVEAALSAFDTQFSTSMLWERNERPINVAGFFEAFVAPSLQQDTGAFVAELSKRTATGSLFSLRNNTNYEFNTNPSNLFPSSWTTNIEAEFRQPFLQGAGVQFNRIAGPAATPGFFFSNGVVIARINTDIALADFEAAVRNLLSDVEIAYWELYFFYRNLDAVIAGRDSALQTWRKVYALYNVGARGGEAEAESQAREQYFLFRAQVEDALSQLYGVENRLRYLMGLAATDGRLIRPADEPTTAQVTFDWFEIHTEALVRNVDLRRQKWRIEQRELELIGTRNFLLPRLDAVGRYRWVGFGDDLIDSDGNNPIFDNAFETLTGGDFQEWQLGLQFQMPIGFRRELAAVRNAQLRLARERVVMQDQELEVSHQLSEAYRNVDRYYTTAQTNFNRRLSAQRQVEAVQAAYETQTVTLDLLLDAQRRLADAESAYYRALADYNKAILDVHFRKGSLLEYHGTLLAEGPWSAKAYFDARKRARERSGAFYMNYGFTRPGVFSRGPVPQFTHDVFDYHEVEGVPTPAEPEPVGTPMPQVAPPERQPAATDPGARRPAEPVLGGARLSGLAEPPLERFDWGTLGLEPRKSPQASARYPARHVNYQQQEWRPGSKHETAAYPTPAANYYPATGWTGTQH